MPTTPSQRSQTRHGPGRATVGDALAEAQGRLRAAGVPNPEVDAKLLAGHVLSWTPARLALHLAEPIPPAAAHRLRASAHRRAAREPLQLIIGSVGFRYLELEVRPGVFIPRPETEVLAGEAVARTPPGGIVVEPCTGTGAVACCVAAEVEGATVVATDSSPAAVALARHNAARARADVAVVEGDLLDPLPPGLRGTVDVLVCNPPYLADRELAGLEPEVRDHDPLAALAAGPTGFEVTDRLLAEAGDWLRRGGALLVEVDPSRAQTTAARARAEGYGEVSVIPDLTGADRIVAARRR